MKLSVIALDYDGTIARQDRVDPSVLQAIAEARARGIIVVLVTGRILAALRRAAGDLHFVDGVVAENGAVLHFPDSGHTARLAPGLPDGYLAGLRQRRIPHEAGDCLVDADAKDAPRLLEVIRATELPLVLLFNGGRVMTLPQGVSKATGLRALLDTLRISAHNTVAIGDAENDHELLRLAGVGCAVQWGSAALRASADLEIQGSGPVAVGAFIKTLASERRMPAPERARRRLRLGYSSDGHEFSLAVRGRNVLIAGDAKTGKSWVAGLLCEQLILLGLCVCVIDPEGDYRSLEALPGVTVLGGDDPPPTPRELARALRYPDRSVVIDLSHLPQDDKIEYIRAVLPTLNGLRRQSGFPHRIVVDEAHYFLHDADALNLLDLEGNGHTFITYWASRLPAPLIDAADVLIVTRESNPAEIAALRQRCRSCDPNDPEPWTVLERLTTGEAVALPVTAEAEGRLRRFALGPRLTPHVRHRGKYIDVPITASRAFVFDAATRATTLRQFVDALDRLDPRVLDGFVRRGDFSRWIRHVFGDYPLAVELEALEARYRRDGAGDAASEMAQAIRTRYSVDGSDA
jgi:hydroxymethylpyrimidine pyrophosphatase-like HAD family hydrolase